VPKLHIDVETYSEVDLKKVGSYAYAAHPSTQIELFAYAFEDFPVNVWDATVTPWPPYDLLKYLNDPTVELHAFNAQFERLIIQHCMHMYLLIERYHCTMVHAWSLSFSGGLDQIGQQVGLPHDLRKTKDGHRLVMKFCKPAPKNHKADRYTSKNAPEDWARYIDYNRQDVEAERAIHRLIEGYKIPDFERRLWIADQRINDRGLPIDLDVVRGAVKIYHEEKERLKAEMNRVTYLANANSIQQLQPWLAARGLETDTLDKDFVKKALKKELAEDVRYVLELRQKISRTSAAKWEALLRATTEDGRLRGTFAFGGAQRTQRWAGRIFQPHNLPRPSRDDTDLTAGILATGDRAMVELLYGDVMQFLTVNIRSAVTAPKGKKLVVSDLASIESRILGWATGCARINAIFAEGKDTYRDFAVEIFSVEYQEVTKEQRNFSKPPALGSGYMLGAKGLKIYAEGYGVEMDEEESQRITTLYRKTYPEIPAAWRWLSDAFKNVIEHQVQVAEGCGVRIYRDTNFLFMELPSGRRIAYYQPRMEMQVPPWEREKVEIAEANNETYIPKKIPAITYLGMNQYTRKWTRQTAHGGRTVEQLCQSMARDILAVGLVDIEENHPEMQTVLHVHDEIGALIDEQKAPQGLVDLETLMSVTPEWAPGLLLNAEGLSSFRYKKG